VYPLVIKALSRQAAVALIGPRQVGKTTLALEIGKEFKSVYLDLEAKSDRDKLFDPELYLSQYQDHLVILDEIHRMPELFQTLRGMIDKARRTNKPTGRYLILGSASMDLLRQSSESLAGRIEYIEMTPLNILEVATNTTITYYNQLWLRGGFPGSYLANNDQDSLVFRKNFIRTYLERDIPQFGFRIPAETLERFWTMLAYNQGGLLNASRLAAGLAVSVPTIGKYVDLLVDLLLVCRLQPYHANITKRQIKAPKIYIRDSGLVHALLGLTTYDQLAAHPVVGSSFEGYVIENIMSMLPDKTPAYFYRSSNGAEIDLILNLPNNLGIWAIEIKRGLSARPNKGFYYAIDDIQPSRSFVVYAGKEHYKLAENIEAISLEELCLKLKTELVNN
jgi:predicted AAA+ superfamily ATPase